MDCVYISLLLVVDFSLAYPSKLKGLSTPYSIGFKQHNHLPLQLDIVSQGDNGEDYSYTPAVDGNTRDDTNIITRVIRGDGQKEIAALKNQNLQFPYGMLFSRFDRRQDNFMRLGRSQPRSSETLLFDNTMGLRQFDADGNGYGRAGRSSGNFMRLGRALEGLYERKAKGSNFMRLGRGAMNAGSQRMLRSPNSFMRLGRAAEQISDTPWIRRDLAGISGRLSGFDNSMRLAKMKTLNFPQEYLTDYYDDTVGVNAADEGEKNVSEGAKESNAVKNEKSSIGSAGIVMKNQKESPGVANMEPDANTE